MLSCNLAVVIVNIYFCFIRILGSIRLNCIREICASLSCLIMALTKEDIVFVDTSGGSRLLRLKQAFSDPMTELYLMFFQYVIPMFESRNLLLQRGDPQIHQLYSIYEGLYEDLLQSFLEPAYIMKFEGVTKIQLDAHTVEYIQGKY